MGEKREGERERELRKEVHVYGWKVPRQMLYQLSHQGSSAGQVESLKFT